MESHVESAMPCKSQACSGNTTIMTSTVFPHEEHRRAGKKKSLKPVEQIEET